MPSPNEELQQYEDEYFDRRFNESLRGIFSFRALGGWAFVVLFFISGVNAFHFYPSNFGTDVGLALCGVAALGLTALFASRSPPKPNGKTIRSNAIRSLVAGLLGTAFLAPIIFNFSLGLFTAIIGTPGEQRAIEERWRDGTVRGYCAGPVIQGVWIDRNIVCLDRHRWREFPDGTHLTLKGKVSPLGMNVEDALPHW